MTPPQARRCPDCREVTVREHCQLPTKRGGTGHCRVMVSGELVNGPMMAGEVVTFCRHRMAWCCPGDDGIGLTITVQLPCHLASADPAWRRVG
jgi:hypothetical protein